LAPHRQANEGVILLRSKLTAVLALCVGAALMLAAVASAGTPPYATHVTIKEENGDFHGKVKSPEGGQICIENRKVTVFKKKDGPDQKVNSDTSGSDGSWNTGNTHVGHGKYYAKAKAVFETRAAKGVLFCEKGKSETVTVN
jgi:hypothetical protein